MTNSQTSDSSSRRLRIRETTYLTWLDSDYLVAVNSPSDDDVLLDRNGRTAGQYVVRVYGPRGLVTEQTVTLTRSRPVTPTPGE